MLLKPPPLYFLILFFTFELVSSAFAQNVTKEDEAIAKTLSRIYTDGSNRLIGLFCRTRCLKQRKLLPRWVRSFNEEFRVPPEERAGIHFHLYKKPLGLNSVDAVLNRSAMAVFYFVADQGFQYMGDLNSEVSFSVDNNTFVISE